MLLAEHKSRTRERERERELHPPHSQQNPPSLRDPDPSGHDAAHPAAHGNGPAPDAAKPSPLGKPRFHGPPGLPRYVPTALPSPPTVVTVSSSSSPTCRPARLNSSHGGGTPGDPAAAGAAAHESAPHHHHHHTVAGTTDGLSRPSSDEGENEEREDAADKLDCHYSGYHPRPVAVSTHTSLSSLLPSSYVTDCIVKN